MPDMGYLQDIRITVTPSRERYARRAMMLAAILAGTALAAAATGRSETAQAVQAAGPELTRLLRAMAGLKLMFAAGLLAAMVWRLQCPATAWRLAGYMAAAACMAAGPVLIWDMAHVRAGAALLHGELLASVVLLWRDPAMAQRLSHAIDRRRAALREGLPRQTVAPLRKEPRQRR